MNIAELIRREGVKRFAESVGISRPYALQLRDGVYFPSFALLARSITSQPGDRPT